MADALQWISLGLAVWCAPSAIFLACIALGGLARGRHRPDEDFAQGHPQRLRA